MSTHNPANDFLNLFNPDRPDKHGSKDENAHLSPFDGEGLKTKGKDSKDSKEQAKATEETQKQETQDKQERQVRESQKEIAKAAAVVESLAARVQAEVQAQAARSVKTDSSAKSPVDGAKPLVEIVLSQLPDYKAKPAELKAFLAAAMTTLQAPQLTQKELTNQIVDRDIARAPQGVRDNYASQLSNQPLTGEQRAEITAWKAFNRTDFLSQPEDPSKYNPDTRLSDIGRSLVEMRERINLGEQLNPPPNLAWCKDIKNIVGDGKGKLSDQQQQVVTQLINAKVTALQRILNNPDLLDNKAFMDKVVNVKDNSKLSEFLTRYYPTRKIEIPAGMPQTFAADAARHVRDSAVRNQFSSNDGLTNGTKTLSQVKDLLIAGKQADALALISPAKAAGDPLIAWYQNVLNANPKERINILTDKISAIKGTLNPSGQTVEIQARNIQQGKSAPNLDLVNVNFLDAMEQNAKSLRTHQAADRPSIEQESMRQAILQYTHNSEQFSNYGRRQSGDQRVQTLQGVVSIMANGIAQQLPFTDRRYSVQVGQRPSEADAQQIKDLIEQKPLKLGTITIPSVPAAPNLVPKFPARGIPSPPQTRNDAPINNNPENLTLAGQGLQQAFIHTGSPGEVPVVGAPAAQPVIQEASQKAAQVAQSAQKDQSNVGIPASIYNLIYNTAALYSTAIYANAFGQSDSRVFNPFSTISSNQPTFSNVQDYYSSRSANNDSLGNPLSLSSLVSGSDKNESPAVLNNIVQRQSDSSPLSSWYLNGPGQSNADSGYASTAPTEDTALYSTSKSIDTSHDGKPNGGSNSSPRSNISNNLVLSVLPPSRSASFARTALGSSPLYGSGVSNIAYASNVKSGGSYASGGSYRANSGSGGGRRSGISIPMHCEFDEDTGYGFLLGKAPGSFSVSGLSSDVINKNKDKDNKDGDEKSNTNLFTRRSNSKNTNRNIDTNINRRTNKVVDTDDTVNV